jgi:signal transduction histidine kinase
MRTRNVSVRSTSTSSIHIHQGRGTLLTGHERAGVRIVPTPTAERIDLLAVIGHDLRQPLSAALMAIEFVAELIEEGSCANVAHSQVGIAQRCMRQAIRMADDLLAMGQARGGALQLRRSPVDLASLLEEACALLAPHALARRVEIQISVEPSLPRPMADPDRLLQVVGNICGNAVKFTPAGGRIVLSATAHGDSVEVSVTDSGPGVRDNHLPHIFDPYWQSNGAAAGAGLGLTIAKWIVEAHGGSIAARTARAGGLTVAFTIPLYPPAEPAGNRPANDTLAGR